MVFALRVTVAPDRLDAASGESFDLAVTVRNTSDIVEHYAIDVLGLPPGANAVADPEVTKLRPGETGSATVRLTLQQDPPTPAGYYILGVLAHSRYREEVSRCEELPLTVRPEERVNIRVAPEVATGGRSARYAVEVANVGNTPLRLRLSSTDPERRVQSSFQPPGLDLMPGATAQALMSVSAPIPWSKEVQRQLRIEAAGTGVEGTGAATFVQRPRFASKLTRVAGMLLAVLVLAGAVLGAALIARKANEPAVGPDAAASGPPDPDSGQQGGQSPTPPAASPTAPGGESPSPGASASAPPGGGGPAEPVTIDLTGPPAPQSGLVPSDAFQDKGITLSGLVEPGKTPPECADASAVVVDRQSPGAPFITPTRPDNQDQCRFVPLQIRFVQPAAAVVIELGGVGERRLEVSYRNLSVDVSPDLRAVDDGEKGGIDFVVIRPKSPDLSAELPATAVKSVTFTPLVRD
jgi:hypothetical protein